LNEVSKIPNSPPIGGSLNPNWIVGFTDAEGNFFIDVKVNTVTLQFKVTQANHSNYVLYAMIDYFGCGRVNIDNRTFDAGKFVVTRINDIINILIPFFDQYPLITSKYLNYLDFKEAAFIIYRSEHLTIQGRAKLIELKGRMNNKRPWLDKWNHCQKVNISQLNIQWLVGFIDGEGTFEYY